MSTQHLFILNIKNNILHWSPTMSTRLHLYFKIMETVNINYGMQQVTTQEYYDSELGDIFRC